MRIHPAAPPSPLPSPPAELSLEIHSLAPLGAPVAGRPHRASVVGRPHRRSPSTPLR
ncbi:hypothetical protein ACP4OV_003026 [Aristida adscensionis]